MPRSSVDALASKVTGDPTVTVLSAPPFATGTVSTLVGPAGVVVDGAVVVVAALTTTVTLSVAFCPVVSVTVSVTVKVPAVVYVFVVVLAVASEVMPFDASKSQE